MEDIKKFAKRFNACGNCGTSNDGFDVFRNNHPKYHDWCVQCTNCGRNMQAETLNELLKNWNADVFEEPEKEDLDSSREYMEECICGCSAQNADITKIQDKYHCICPECGRHITADTRRQMVLHWNDRSHAIPPVMIKRHEREVARRREAIYAQRPHTDSAGMRSTRINPMVVARAVEEEKLRQKAKELSWKKFICGGLPFEEQWTLDKAIFSGLL